MKEKIEEIKKKSMEQIQKIQDLKGLEELKIKVLGKKGELTAVLRGMKELAAEERPVVGELVNNAKDSFYYSFA